MNENGEFYFAVMASLSDVFPASLPWFVYSNSLQNVNSSFINLAHVT